MPADLVCFPFAAVTGMELSKRALLLLAVDLGLKGVLIAAAPGRAKSLLVRAYRTIIGLDAPFLAVPPGVTEDRLLGGLDLERTLLVGAPRLAAGLLAQAHGGVLHAEEVNLLDRSTTRHMAGALNNGWVRIEREGLSRTLPSEFSFIGTYDPDEGDADRALVDSVGLHVRETGVLSAAERACVLDRVAAFDRDPALFAERYAAETALLKARVAAARSRLPDVEISLEERRCLSLAALRLGVEGHRSDIFAVRLARAHAALMDRSTVQDDDLQAAIQFVLAPRATALPQEPAGARQALSQPTQLQARPQPRAPSSEAPPHPQAPPGETEPERTEELVLPALETPHSEELPEQPRQPTLRKGGQAGRRSTGASEAVNWGRGRFVRAVAAQPHGRKIALAATLRAAAARHTGTTPFQVTVEDLRFKQFRQKAGVLVIFAVDASGSMALNRMSQAKGALMRFLSKAYLHRDKVALIGFRGRRAEVLLPPTRSVELAKRALDALPVGGGTPLAAGLHAALDLAGRAGSIDVRRTLLVLVTDGGANVPLGESRDALWPELVKVCAALRSDGVLSVVVDSSLFQMPGREAERLAELLGAQCVRLRRLDAQAVYGAAAALAETARSRTD
jgi:magnesium chelatase subunit D